MSLSPSHKTRHNIRKSQPHQKKKYKKDTNYKKQNNTSKTKPKKEVKCFKCGKKGHIASNGKKHKINALSNDKYHLEASEESISLDNSKKII